MKVGGVERVVTGDLGDPNFHEDLNAKRSFVLTEAEKLRTDCLNDDCPAKTIRQTSLSNDSSCEVTFYIICGHADCPEISQTEQ